MSSVPAARARSTYWSVPDARCGHPHDRTRARRRAVCWAARARRISSCPRSPVFRDGAPFPDWARTSATRASPTGSAPISRPCGTWGSSPVFRVGLLAGNRIEVVFCNYAMLLMGCCLVPLHPRGSLGDHAYVARDADLDALIFDAAHFAQRAEALAASVPRVLGLGPSGFASDLSAHAEGFAPRPLVAPVFDPDQVVRISYSGGTTGDPKGHHRHAAHLAHQDHDPAHRVGMAGRNASARLCAAQPWRAER